MCQWMLEYVVLGWRGEGGSCLITFNDRWFRVKLFIGTVDKVHHSAVGSSAAIGAVNVCGYPDLTHTQELSSSVYPQLTLLLPAPLTSRG